MWKRYDKTKKPIAKHHRPERPVMNKRGRPISVVSEQRNGWVE